MRGQSRALVRRIANIPASMCLQRTPPEGEPETDRLKREASLRDDIVIRWSGRRGRDFQRVLYLIAELSLEDRGE